MQKQHQLVTEKKKKKKKKKKKAETTQPEQLQPLNIDTIEQPQQGGQRLGPHGLEPMVTNGEDPGWAAVVWHHKGKMVDGSQEPDVAPKLVKNSIKQQLLEKTKPQGGAVLIVWKSDGIPYTEIILKARQSINVRDYNLEVVKMQYTAKEEMVLELCGGDQGSVEGHYPSCLKTNCSKSKLFKKITAPDGFQ